MKCIPYFTSSGSSGSWFLLFVFWVHVSGSLLSPGCPETRYRPDWPQTSPFACLCLKCATRPCNTRVLFFGIIILDRILLCSSEWPSTCCFCSCVQESQASSNTPDYTVNSNATQHKSDIRKAGNPDHVPTPQHFQARSLTFMENSIFNQ